MEQVSININDGIKMLLEGKTLSEKESEEIMKEIMSGKVEEVQIAAYLIALRMRGETSKVIAGAARAMRHYSNQIKPKYKGILCDTCGTGGDGANTFNISTISSFIAAGAGVSIAKHGNRSISSKCGSADILEAFGVKIDLDAEKVEEIINKIGIGFMFAPKFHPAMKYAMPVRRKLGVRTIFNILGPLTNPADAKGHVLGVFDKSLLYIMADAMRELGGKRVFIVYSEPKVDEIVPTGNIYFTEVNEGKLKSYIKEPESFGIKRCSLDDIKGGDLETNLRIACEILKGKDKGIKRQTCIMNAAHVIIASGMADSYKEAAEMCEISIDSGMALDKLKQLVIESGGSIEKFESVINRF
ncbi:MAG: anthranilate phosphoribosyltransferase [Promethearchaeota archaeon]